MEPFLKALFQFLTIHVNSIMFGRKVFEKEPGLKIHHHHPRQAPVTYWRLGVLLLDWRLDGGPPPWTTSTVCKVHC